MTNKKRTRKRRPSKFLQAILSVPLRVKITIPYLIVASLLAGLATYQVGRSFASTLENRFRSQLTDASTRAAEGIVDVEAENLEMLRTVAFTEGVALAIQDKDLEVLHNLVIPIVANQHYAAIDILSAEGTPLYSLHLNTETNEYIQNQFPPYQTWEIVAKVLSGQSDAGGDKYPGIYQTQWGWMLYTAGPVLVNDELVGVILTGTPLDEIVSRLKTLTIADTSVYSPGIGAISSTFAQIDSAEYNDELTYVQFDEGTLTARQLNVRSRSYIEVVDSVWLRGAPTTWQIGIALPETLVHDPQNLTTIQLVSIFAVGLLALIGLGIIVARLIAKPIFHLVDASQAVGEGNLNVRVDVYSKDEIGFLADRFNRMVRELKNREFMREMFGRMVSEEVREAVLKNSVIFGGENLNVTVLFTDVRGFTQITEQSQPKDVIALLNEFFGIVTDSTKKHDGLINKFGGDSSLAVFGAPIPKPLQYSLEQAIKAALEIQEGMALFNAYRVDRKQPPLRFGIGINSGEVVAGNIGTVDRFEYTVIGDVVNVAARLQGLSRQYAQTSILIPASGLDALSGNVQFEYQYLGEFDLKGKENAVPVYSITGRGMHLSELEKVFQEIDHPLSTAAMACYLHCQGFSTLAISHSLQVNEFVIQKWLLHAAKHYETIAPVLIDRYQISPGKTRRLAPGWIEEKEKVAG